MVAQFGLVGSAFADVAAHSNEKLKEVMQRLGQAYGQVRSAVNGSEMTEATRAKTRTMATIFQETVTLTPDVSHITRDPVQTERLVAQFRKINSEAQAISYQLEMQVIDQDLMAAKASVDLLAQKRREGHEIFRPPNF